MRACAERSTGINAASGDIVHGLSEQCLVEAAKNGHSTAFDTLSGRYREQLLRAARRITRSNEDAEDAVQDSLLNAFVHLRNFDGRSSFGTWLTRIAINSALMNLRKKRGSREIATDYNAEYGADGLRYEVAEWRPNPERQYVQSEKESLLKKAIRGLRPTLRVVVEMQALQESSVRETAEAIGISMAATKGRLFHAKKVLRRSLTEKPKNQTQYDTRIRKTAPGKWLGQDAETSTVHRAEQLHNKKKGEKHAVQTESTPKYGDLSHASAKGGEFSKELCA
jgi:RNA polymerase sigma factor (sigma-70 family)